MQTEIQQAPERIDGSRRKYLGIDRRQSHRRPCGILLRTRSDSFVRTVLLKIDLGWSSVQVDTRCQASLHISMSWSRYRAALSQALSASPRAAVSDPILRPRTEIGSRSTFSVPNGMREPHTSPRSRWLVIQAQSELRFGYKQTVAANARHTVFCVH